MKDLFLKLFEGSISYVAKNIPNEKNRAHYISETNRLKECILRIHDDDLYNLKDLFLIERETEEKVVYPWMQRWVFDVLDNERRYRLLAIEHAIDIVDSLNTRFVSGGERVYYWWN